MKTYQDLLNVNQNEKDRMAFVKTVMTEHKNTDLYRTAKIAKAYFRHRNVTIENYQKVLYKVTGGTVPDNYSANYKMANRFFYRFLVQENQYSLGNGVSFKNKETSEKLGTKEKPFDNQIQKAGIEALQGGVSFGFYNLDHIDVFSVLEYAPLFDEISGGMKAGVRFWQVDSNKPLRATLYELDGYTEYLWLNKETVIDKDWIFVDQNQYCKKKRPYVLTIGNTKIDGDEIITGENYPDFPIVPLWANTEHQSELVGMREQLDAYDLIKNSTANDVDASIIYWTLTNAGGMDEMDLAKFLEQLKRLHATTLDDDIQAEAHTVDIPVQSREAILDRIERDLYRDAMALNTENIANGAVTATQIQASYEPLNAKADMYEYCLIDFINKILALAGIDDEPTFTRSKIVNTTEEIQVLNASAPNLTQEYVTRKTLELMGDGDKADEIASGVLADNIPTVE